MGYYATLDVYVEIKDVAGLLAAIQKDRPESIISGSDATAFDAAFASGDTDKQLNEVIAGAAGFSSWVPEVVYRDSKGVTKLSMSGEARMYDQGTAFDYLAKHGVRGSVDATGEDAAHWQYQFTPDGVTTREGWVAYEEEPASILLASLDYDALAARKPETVDALLAALATYRKRYLSV